MKIYIRSVDPSKLDWARAPKSRILSRIVERARQLAPGQSISVTRVKPYWVYQLRRRLGAEYRVGTLKDGTIGILRLPPAGPGES